ncbi:RNA methyltransferase tRNA(m5U54)methyltransferase [Paecilomyces lecythidis]
MATSSSPAAAAPPQIVQVGDKEYEAVKEGLAYILNPRPKDAPKQSEKGPKGETTQQSVFYNPIQQFNRDLSVLAIKAYGEHLLAVKKEKLEKKKQRMAQNGFAKGKKRKRENQDGDEGAGNAVPEHNDNTAAASEPPTDQPSETGGVAVPPEEKPLSFTILDALSATGLRALRYAKEIPFATCIVSNDLSPSAVQSQKINIEYNKVEDTVKPNSGDACAYMYSHNKPHSPGNSSSHTGRFDVIDLDPYGTAAPFMDAAVQSVNDGGLLCVTCTDAGVWASNGYPEKAFALYGGITMKGYHSHEGGLRLILHALATSAAKYGLAIEPLLSLSIDFYARVFVRVYKSPAEVKFISGNTMLVYNCDAGCGAWSIQPLSHTRQKLDKKGNPFYNYGYAQGPTAAPHCEHCGFKTHLSGPMWAGPLHNPHFIQKILDMLPGIDRDTYHTVDRIEGMLTTALEEDLDMGPSKTPGSSPEPGQEQDTTLTSHRSPIIPRADPAQREPHPFFFSVSAISKVLHTQTMPVDAFRGALRHLGYRSTRSHAKPNSIRTDAPWDVIWEIMREWVRQKSPIKEGALKPGTAGAVIMKKSRENLAKLHESDHPLSLLKQEITAAVESGRNVSDLITKIEAALYRSGARQQPGKDTSGTDTEMKDASEQQALSKDEPDRSTRAGSPSAQRPHPSTLNIVFDEALGREASDAQTKKRLVRYQVNPRENWGPLSRATGSSR